MNAKRSILLATQLAVAALLLIGLLQAKASAVPATNDSSTAVVTESLGGSEQPSEVSAATGAGQTFVTVEGLEAASTGVPTTLLGVLALAFLGGLILNVMPCVLPVVSIKILSFVQQAGEEPRRVFRLGLAFAAGIVVSFEALGISVVALKAGGAALGWGFQFQSPTFLVVMLSIIFVFGLSLFGVFTISLPGAASTRLSTAEQREGYLGAFAKGVLATVLATPCTAPYLGPALGVAFASGGAKLFAIFTAVGIGMASPYVIFTAKPAWLRFLPKPGAWMEHFKQFMGFILMGTVVWLLFTIGAHIGAEGLTWTIAYLCFLGLAVWLLGRQTPSTPPSRRLAAWASSLVIVIAGWWFSFERSFTFEKGTLAVKESHDCADPAFGDLNYEQGIPWRPWRKGLPEQLARAGYTVYVDYTASWCPNCLANKKLMLEADIVRNKMGELCVVPLRADLTQRDPEIIEDLQRFGRSAIPVNVIYPAGKPDSPVLLPELLVGRTDLVASMLEDAGPSARCGSVRLAMLGPSVGPAAAFSTGRDR